MHNRITFMNGNKKIANLVGWLLLLLVIGLNTFIIWAVFADLDGLRDWLLAILAMSAFALGGSLLFWQYYAWLVRKRQSRKRKQATPPAASEKSPHPE